MRSRASWPSTLFLVALLASGCDAGRGNFHHEFHAFGTIVSLSFYGVTAADSDAALAELQSLYAGLGTDLYPWAAGELRNVNDALARGEEITVSDTLLELIRLSRHYEFESDGRFSAGLGRLSELWGMQPGMRTPEQPPAATMLSEFVAGRPLALALDIDGKRISSPNPDLVLDFGGIAKGFILAMSVKLLERSGITNAIVNIGGDLFVLSDRYGRAANIGIRSPFGATPVAGLTVQDYEAVVTSGNYERYVDIGGRRYTHIFDPRTGYPVEHTASVTVVDPDPVLADAAATALLVGGPDEFDEIVDAMHLRYALLIDAGGDTRLTPALAERLNWAGK